MNTWISTKEPRSERTMTSRGKYYGKITLLSYLGCVGKLDDEHPPSSSVPPSSFPFDADRLFDSRTKMSGESRDVGSPPGDQRTFEILLR